MKEINDQKFYIYSKYNFTIISVLVGIIFGLLLLTFQVKSQLLLILNDMRFSLDDKKDVILDYLNSIDGKSNNVLNSFNFSKYLNDDEATEKIQFTREDNNILKRYLYKNSIENMVIVDNNKVLQHNVFNISNESLDKIINLNFDEKFTYIDKDKYLYISYKYNSTYNIVFVFYSKDIYRLLDPTESKFIFDLYTNKDGMNNIKFNNVKKLIEFNIKKNNYIIFEKNNKVYLQTSNIYINNNQNLTLSNNITIFNLILLAIYYSLLPVLILLFCLIFFNLVLRRIIVSNSYLPIKNLIEEFQVLNNYDLNTIINYDFSMSYKYFSELIDEVKKFCTLNQKNYDNQIKKLNNDLLLAIESSKSKSLFLANMSHEMRTPLNSIIGYIQLLNNLDINNEKIKEYFERINTCSNLLMQKINDILDLSKIEANRFEIIPKPTNFKKLVQEVYDMLIINANAKNIEFSYHIDQRIPTYLEIDEMRLKQVLVNICSNAIKFTSKGFVKVEIDFFGYTNNGIVLDYKITDTGCGIPKDKIDMIFLPFIQVENKELFNTGTGLGLTIARDLIQLMGGKLTVTSKEGVGSIFSFTTIFSPCTNEVQENKYEYEINNNFVENKLFNKKILIAEDNYLNQVLIMEIFKVFNKYDIVYASDGKEAINLCANNKYDIIFMDIQMPNIDGIEATKTIRTMDSCKDVPIIALTANAFNEQINEYLNIGMNDFLPKPIEITKFKKILIKYL